MAKSMQGSPFLLDDVTGKIVGVKNSDGTEQSWFEGGARFTGARGATAIIMGDSLAANNWITTGSTFATFASEGCYAWANFLSGQRLRISSNVAVSGKTAAQMVNEQLPAVLAARPNYALIVAGHNDIYSASRSGVETFNSLRDTLNALLDAGIVPVYTTIPARSYSTAALLKEHLIANDLIRKYAQSNGGGIFWDGFKVTVDPASTQGAVRSGFAYDSAPSIHPNNVGAYWLGKACAAQLNRVLRPFSALAAGSTDYGNGSEYINLLDNPMMTGTGGTNGTGGSGSVPTGFSITRAAGTPTWTTAIVDVTDADTGQVIGKGIQNTITFGAANDEVMIANTTSIHSRMAAGGAYEAECGISVASPVNVDRVRSRVNADSGSGEAAWAMTGAQTQANVPEAFSGVHRTRQIAALGAPIAGGFEARIRASAAGSAVWTVWTPCVRRVAA